ncbi:MAG: B12-binding domain-containing radical SAM protein [Chloroflexi bacterium]|nr:MAG: B12-binding domain-containing radical SAM protein [Chloroflexota bacterium]
MLILYNPPSSARRKPVMPLALLALGALMEGRHEYAIVDGNLDTNALETIDRHVRDGARMLGITVMPGPQLADAVPLCRELKRRHPGLTIIWGGYFPTQHWDVCLKSGFVDYVVRGHGEVVFQSLVDRLASGENPTDLAGLAYPQADGLPFSNPTAPIPHPDLMPEFPYQRIDVRRYARKSFMGRRTLAHHSSYGCPFFCNFCAVVNMVGGRWLAQSAERTANVARRLVTDYGADAVEFYDNNFFVHEARTVDFAERILDLGIGWWGDSRIDTLLRYSDRSWRLMRDSGLRMVFMGAESGSDETLKRMNKGGSASTDKTLAMAEKAREYGIVPEFSFVLGNPPDPEGDVRGTLEFIRKVKRVNPHTEIIMYVYTPVPLAGELYDQAKAEGFAFPETLDEWVSGDWQDFAQRRSAQIPWLDDPLRRHLRDFERVLSAYYPTITNPSLHGVRRFVLRAASAWRYHLGFYRYPYELRPLQRLLAYQRPETCGF